MTTHAFDMRPLKATLATYEHESPIVQAWYRDLGRRFNDTLVGPGIEMAIAILSHDVARGKSGFASMPLPGELVGLDHVLVAAIEMGTMLELFKLNTDPELGSWLALRV